MKKIIVIGFFLFAAFNISAAQTYSATIALDKIDISNKKAGDDVIVPVRLVEKSGGLMAGLQLFIGFDHSKFSWKGTTDNPLPGIKNLNSLMPYMPNVWIFNDNGSQLAASWIDPNLTGIDVANGSVIVEYVFTYKGGLKAGEESPLIWGETFELTDGRATKGATEMTSELMNNYKLTKINGAFTNLKK